MSYRKHNKTYISNCHKLHSRKHSGAYSEETALLDWSDEELDGLGGLSVRYSSNPSYYDEIKPNENEKQFSVNERDFSELLKYNDPKEKCSTSWATAAIGLAEAALDYKVRLSVNQLFECLPKKEMINGCDGVHPNVLMKYLIEEGLVEDEEFQSCDSLKDITHYYFSPIQPESPNAGGLMNLIAEENQPVFVMVAMDLKKLRFVKDMSNAREGVRCADYQPSLYGLVTGYHYEESIENSWWEITTYIIPGERVIVKVPMSSNMENANYAGIAGYAYGLRKVEEMTEEPTTEPPTTEPPTTEPPLCRGSLNITSNDDCGLLFETNWERIDISSGLCNTMNGTLSFSDNSCLEELMFHARSLQLIQSLTISNNTNLKTITTEIDACFSVKSLVLTSLMIND